MTKQSEAEDFMATLLGLDPEKLRAEEAKGDVERGMLLVGLVGAMIFAQKGGDPRDSLNEALRFAEEYKKMKTEVLEELADKQAAE